MKKVYAITGGIGSGKSTVSAIIKDMGYEVFSADETYANLIKNHNFSREIYQKLGLTYNENVGFERSVVSSVVFADSKKLKILNEFTHNKVMIELKRLTDKKTGIVFHEVPLLFENGYEILYDGVIVVYRNKNERIKSVISRDGLTKEEVEKRIKNQYDYENNSINAHTVIVNDGDLNNLKSEVKAVIDRIEKNN